MQQKIRHKRPKHLYILTVYTGLCVLNVGGIKMPTLTLSIPEELKHEMDEEKEINWSEVARAAIKNKLSQLKILKAISAKSKLTHKDALELGRKINASLHKKYAK